jgi:hypothetical protein
MGSAPRSGAPHIPGRVPPDDVPHVPLPARAATALGWFRAIFWMAVYLAGTIVVLALALDFVIALACGDVPQWWLAKLVCGIAFGALQRIAAAQLKSGDSIAAPDNQTTPTSPGSA